MEAVTVQLTIFQVLRQKCIEKVTFDKLVGATAQNFDSDSAGIGSNLSSLWPYFPKHPEIKLND